MDIKINSGKQEEIPKNIFEKVLKLRLKIYKNQGFISHKIKRDYDKYDKDAFHIIATKDSEVVGYLRLVKEMPLLSLYKEEVREIMKKNHLRNPVELSRFVISPYYRISKRKIEDYSDFVSFLLFKKAYQFIFTKNIDCVFIVTHPKYKKRYENFYFFKQYGKEKSYSEVEGNPAVLLYQDVREAAQKSKKESPVFHKFMVKEQEDIK